MVQGSHEVGRGREEEAMTNEFAEMIDCRA